MTNAFLVKKKKEVLCLNLKLSNSAYFFNNIILHAIFRAIVWLRKKLKIN